MNKREMGKKSRAAGQRFEKKVREDLEKKGWVVDKWTNNVSLFPMELIPAKPKFVFNPKTKTRQMISNNSGFPDFIAYKEEVCGICYSRGFGVCGYGIMGVEAKSNGILDKIEKEKCGWLIKNKIFNKIIVASKGEKREKIKYIDYVEI